jgi:hypothetical protein
MGSPCWPRTATRVVDNIAANDVTPGILVENRHTTLRANVATRIQAWGINAVRGVNAGGNMAAENSGPGQCRNVACEAPEGWAPTGVTSS